MSHQGVGADKAKLDELFESEKLRLSKQLKTIISPSVQERVVVEKSFLDENLRRLEAFRASPTFATLPEAEQSRLTRQSRVMDEYSGILAERIEAFGA